MQSIYGKLLALKSKVRKWEHREKKNMIKELADIKMELEKFGKILDAGNPTPKLINRIKGLEEKKQKILHIQEVT